jgi:RimJ/RimL family protein N-acetyltransferase
VTTLSPRTLIDLQAEALFTHDANGRILRINEPDGGPAPRFFLGRTPEGNIWRIRHDVPVKIARELESLSASEPVSSDVESPPAHLDAMLDALDRHQPASLDHAGPAFRFPDELPTPVPGVTRLTFANRHLLREMPDWGSGIQDEAEFEGWGPCLVMVEDGVAVSICACARLTADAAEAGLETHERYRGRGHAANVVAAWARAIRDSGRIPLYSTDWDNHASRAIRDTGRIPLYSTDWENQASRAVARKLGLIMYGSDLSLR